MLFGESEAEAEQTSNMLLLRGYLGGQRGVIARFVTPKGWQRFEEVSRKRGATDAPAFVAMWFGDKKRKQQMDKMYEEGFKPGVEGAGYKV